ncbi:alpha/beta hydrolase [Streptosporangium roseum]|uniref:alpha/beta hydrolase n=1 Tax=Streptosporangium roseum TaxID=2001 RepID=UPI001E62DC98|nr:alpha/beta hydrolase [Streptosporangium roseum]
MDRALVVDWSYGAFVAAHGASRNPARTVSVVLVDGAQPYDRLDEVIEQRIRKLFRRMSWLLPLLRPTGLTPWMTAEQIANSTIEIGRIARERERAPCWTTSPSPCGMWSRRGHSLEARVMSKNAFAPASLRWSSAARTPRSWCEQDPGFEVETCSGFGGWRHPSLTGDDLMARARRRGSTRENRPAIRLVSSSNINCQREAVTLSPAATP